MSFRPTQTGLCKFGWVWRSLISQKRPDVHKTVLSKKLCSPPPPEKSVNFEDFLLICRVFLILGPFRGGGGKTKFWGQEFMDTQTFLNKAKVNHLVGRTSLTFAYLLMIAIYVSDMLHALLYWSFKVRPALVVRWWL